MMKEPALRDDAFLDDVRAARARTGALHIWWLGQSGFLIQWRGAHLLFDPYLSDSLTRKYAATDKPHERMTARVVDPARLDFVDVVTSSHNHTDHLDAETLCPMFAANPGMGLVIPEANRAFVAERLGMAPGAAIGLDDGTSADVSGFRIHGIASAHDELKTDAAGRHQFLGYAVEVGPWVVYHSGDTRLYPGLAERLRRFRIDVALLPINGCRPERRVAGNMSAREAVSLARDVGACLAIPHHYDMFKFNTADPEEFARESAEAGLPARVPRQGERVTLLR